MPLKTTSRDEILRLVASFAEAEHARGDFVPGVTPVPASGKVYGAPELVSLVDASLDFWLTTGRFNDEFEKKFAAFVGVRQAKTVNSGSSANLLALASLTSPKLGDKALRPGDEVITVAAGFPTTVNPALLYGLVPVFIDVHIPTYNLDPDQLERAVTPKTRAVMAAHTLGNPFNLDAVMNLAKRHNLWVIEDCCDALGATYRGRHVGTFGHLATCSFYPAHHITMGEGGAVFTDRADLNRLVESLRDWGRSCYCAPGADNTCGKRFGWKMGDLPAGYDHKYIYDQLGFNLKITDMQAAVALSQMDRLPGFIEARKKNFARLRKALEGAQEFFILPKATGESVPSWFGFPITIAPGAPFERVELLRFLDAAKVGTRLLFGGNLTKQPYFKGRTFRMASDLRNTDVVMERTFWVGVYPGLSDAMIDYVAERLLAFARAR